jgi:proline iminopeptidase
VTVDPTAALVYNTTWDLVADIEALRSVCGITGPWTVFGGSWGSTLALAYAARHPASVAALVLRGVFLGEPWESEWLYSEEGGAARLAPQEWARFGGRRTARATFRQYGRAFRSRRSRKAALRAWNRWETVLSTLEPPAGPKGAPDAMALLEHHYFRHGCWLRPGQLLAAARQIPASVPVLIVQGRYDLVCPPASAVALHEAIPHSRLTLTQAGHSAREPATARALRAALSVI